MSPHQILAQSPANPYAIPGGTHMASSPSKESILGTLSYVPCKSVHKLYILAVIWQIIGYYPGSIVSCPGKVLVAGGYLVLDQEYQGLVVGTDARLYSAVQSVADLDKHGLAPNHVPADNLQNISNKQEVARIKVVSAQFHEAVWNYGVYVDEKSEIEIHQLFDQAGDNGDEGKPKNTNRFIEATLRATLFVINNIDDSKKLVSSKLKDLRIILAADNDFYSQSQALKERGLPPTTLGLSNLPKFCHTKCTLTNVNKTGLGSSAAMVTSLVGSLLHHFGVVGNLSSQSDSDKAKVEADKALIHNISQYAHCLAQGKIGSGFDVSSAIYGSHIYNRFSPNVIADAMGNESDAKLVAKTCLNSSIWNNKVTEVKIPPGFILRLADVDTGSHTPSMVSKVIRWRKNNPNEASKLWEKISNTNQRICEIWKELSDISEQDPESYISGITQCSALPYSKWKTQADRNKTMDLLIELGGTCKTVRSLLKELGDNSDVPIEPSEQTRLLDACMECPGVVMAGVPGAGGYDAIYCISLDSESAHSVEELWTSWTDSSVKPLLTSQSSGGIKVESSTKTTSTYKFFSSML